MLFAVTLFDLFDTNQLSLKHFFPQNTGWLVRGAVGKVSAIVLSFQAFFSTVNQPYFLALGNS